MVYFGIEIFKIYFEWYKLQQLPPFRSNIKTAIDGHVFYLFVFLFEAGFMAYVERDAKRRAEAKKKEIKRSDYLKTMGNHEYRKGNYEKALIYYNQVSECFI